MRFRPEQPMHAAYAFLSPAVGEEVVTIGRLVNAGVQLLRDPGQGHRHAPIDYACPDVALTSLPWAIKALVR